jgi:Na+/H+ antiporter NhaC
MLMVHFPMNLYPIVVIAIVFAVVLLIAYLRKRGDL